MAVVLTHNAYGKSQVRLTKVTRYADRHDLADWCVDVQLAGDFAAAYTDGDNRRVVATDTMKNVVYALARDRILATDLTADWRYADAADDWDAAYQAIRRALLETFAGHQSLGVQQTLHALGAAALAACPAVEEITLTMPNRHRLLVELAPFGR